LHTPIAYEWRRDKGGEAGHLLVVLHLWEMSSALVKLALQLDALGVDIISATSTTVVRRW